MGVFSMFKIAKCLNILTKHSRNSGLFSQFIVENNNFLHNLKNLNSIVFLMSCILVLYCLAYFVQNQRSANLTAANVGICANFTKAS